MKLARAVLSKALFASVKRFMTITTLLVDAYFHFDYRSPVWLSTAETQVYLIVLLIPLNFSWIWILGIVGILGLFQSYTRM